VVSTISGPSSRPRAADWLFLITTMTDGWTFISQMGIGWMHIGPLERRRSLIYTRTIETVRLPTSPRSQDWALLVGRLAYASATTTTTDGTICFAPSGGITSCFTTMEMGPSRMLLVKPDFIRNRYVGALAVLFSTMTGTATSIFSYVITSSWIQRRFLLLTIRTIVSGRASLSCAGRVAFLATQTFSIATMGTAPLLTCRRNRAF